MTTHYLGLVCWALCLGFLSQDLMGAESTARTGATVTALDRYVAAPDPSYSWKLDSSTSQFGVTAHAIDMVSQTWLTTNEVNRTVWRHWLVVVMPEKVEFNTAFLFITGGANRPGPAPSPSREMIEVAKATHSVVAELRMVPNQPLIFDNDGVERVEDALISHTWDKYLQTGDERWPARLPMTKAAVRAMDTITAFCASDAGGHHPVEAFVVAGGSKRGWTTWTTAIVDRRVVAISPAVIDVLNMGPSMVHHFQAYGFFAPSVGNYVERDIMKWLGTPEMAALQSIEDPFFYRDRLTMPKLILNACGDQYFLPDSSQFYFGDLPGPKYLRYVPNTDHSMRDSDAYESLLAWHYLAASKSALPKFSWSKDADGSLRVKTTDRPRQVVLWQAFNPSRRDFRLETAGPLWKSVPVDAVGAGEYVAPAPHPASGWAAYLVELTFDVGAPTPLKLTTDVTVTPDSLPFPAPNFPHPKGFLSR
jgi:PhoPQ-activated pathogenicity-related protein